MKEKENENKGELKSRRSVRGKVKKEEERVKNNTGPGIVGHTSQSRTNG